MEKRFTYNKQEKLKSRKAIDALFTSGKTIQQFPVKLFYTVTEADAKSVHAGVGVSKRYFKKAVDRNRIKRLLREAYRLNKHSIEFPENKATNLFFLYTDKQLPDFIQLNEIFQKLFIKLEKQLR